MCESQARFASSNAGAYDDDDPFASDSEGPSSMRDQEAERQEFLSRASPDKALGYFADELTQVDFSERERRRIRDKVLKWDEKDVTPAQRARTKTRLGEASPFRKFDPYTYQDLQNRAAEFWAPEDEFNWKLEGLGPITSKDMVHRKRGGLLQDYCVFCYHGTSQMRPENTTLLTKFVSDAGQILPRRSTKCCAKHQRKLRRTIKRARVLQLMPYNQRLHPKLRATQFMPDPETHKPVTFTTPRDAFRAAQAYEAWVWNHASNRKGRNVPQVDWFPSEE